MTEQKQPEALRLIAEWRNSMPIGVMRIWAADVRDELRRQHAEIERLRAKLDELEKQEPVAVKNHNPHLHMVGPDDGGRVSIDELSAIPIGTKLYLAAGAVEQAQESDQHRVSDCDPLLLAYFDAYARTLVKKPHKMTPEMWPEGFPFFKAGFERSVTAHARPVEEVPAPALPKPKRKTSKKSCKHNDSGYADGYDDERF